MALNRDDFNRGNFVTGDLTSAGFGPPGGGGGGGGGADPVALAEAAGFGLYWMEEADDYVEGTGAGAGSIYTLKDQTTSQHGGDWSDRTGSTSASLAPRTDDYFRSAIGTTDRFWVNSAAPFSGVMVKIFVYRFPVGAANASNGYIFTHRISTADRPHFLWTSAAGAWLYNSGGGGANDQNFSTEGNNISSSVNPYDGNWHCLLIHHGTQADEGLIIDHDGEQLVPDNSSFTVNDLVAGNFASFFQMASDNSVNSFSPINTIDYRAFAHGPTADGPAHADTRAIASALMSKYSITDLSP